ncbi:MAG: pyruvoyl-dependent arginine decarboxylase [archaeon]
MTLYSKFFLTKGIGFSEVSKLNAFDHAILDAKVGQCNLVPVSSILPRNCEYAKEIPEIEPGEITHCVFSRAYGSKGEEISAGVGFAKTKDYGFAMEESGNLKPEQVEARISEKLKQMAETRKLEITEKGTRVAHIENINEKHGCTVALLIFRL